MMPSSSSLPMAQQEGGTTAAPVKASKAVSCNECRRLKLRCSKTWPCDMCVKRRLAHLCPDGVQKREKGGVQGRSGSSSYMGMHGSSDKERGFNGSLYGDFASLSNASPASSAAGPSNTVPLAMQSRLDSLERKIDLLLASQSSSSFSGHRTPDGSLHDLASIAIDPLRFAHGQRADASETNRSRGTLSMHADGRSSYVGPHAHSVYLAREDLEGVGSGTKSPAKLAASRPGSPTPIDLEAAAQREPSMGEDGVSPLDSITMSSVADGQQAQLTGWTTPGIRSPHSSQAIWTQLRPFLPKRELAKRLINVYYASILFQHEIVSRQEMETELWPMFYGQDETHERSDTPPPGFHPHKISLVFAIFALGILFDVQRPQRDPVGRAFYSCSWNALASSNFTESTNSDTVLAVVHAALYLTWRRLNRYAESAWPLFGTMMSMMTRSGLHRDPAHFDMSEAEREKRRRVFWDVQGVEVLRSLAFCRPPSILDRHVDTRLPNSWRIAIGAQRPASAEERAGTFFALKSYHAQLVNRILDECLCTSSTYSLTMEFDVRAQRLMRMIPAWLSPKIIPLSKRSLHGSEDMERAYWDGEALKAMTEEMRHHIIHLNCHQLRLLLHRGWFSEALQQIGRLSENESQQSPANASADTQIRFQESVDAVNSCASSIIEIITSAWAHYPALVVRWMFFWNGLFSAAVCRGLYAVKRRRGGGALAAWRDLRTAIQLLRHAVDGWKPLEQPLGILLRLHQRAETALGNSGTSSAARTDWPSANASVKSEQQQCEDLQLIGDEKRRVRFAKRKDIVAEASPEPRSKRRNQNGDELQDPQMIANPTSIMTSQRADQVSSPSAQSGTFASSILGQPTFPFIPITHADAGTTHASDVEIFSPSTVRMPASLPTFLTTGALHQGTNGDDSTQASMKHNEPSSSAPDFLTVSSSPLDLHDDTRFRSPTDISSTSKGMQPQNAVHLPTPTSATPANSLLDAKMPSSFPGTATPIASSDNSAQLMQMLSSGMGWDDVASWDNFIFDL